MLFFIVCIGPAFANEYSSLEKAIREELKNKNEFPQEKEYLKLGIKYFYGEGIEKDEKKGLSYILLSAEQGYSFAQLFTAALYAYGMGVIKDNAESYKWCLLASKNKNKYAIELMELLRKDSTLEEINEGYKRAKSFEKDHVTHNSIQNFSAPISK